MKRWLGILVLLWTGSVQAQLSIENPWTRPTPPNARLAAGYLAVVSAGGADRLLGAASPAAARVELHVTVKDGDILRMREVKDMQVPAGGRLSLEPAGPHLMLIDIKRRFKTGEKVPVTLRFEKAGEVKVELLVGDKPGAPSGHHKH